MVTQPARGTSGLPTAAQDRLVALASGASLQTSYLSAASAAALRSTGLSPVGDVMGCATSQISYAYVGSCGWGGGPGSRVALGTTRLSGGSSSYRRRLRDLYATALRRLTGEAVVMGADGVVGIDLTVRVHGVLFEVVAVGTGVRAATSRRPGRPFTTDLPGTDVAKLLLGGWTPVTLHVAVEIGVRHDTNPFLPSTQWAMARTNVEVTSMTEVLQDTKAAARSTLAGQVSATGADGCLLSGLSTSLRRTECMAYGSSGDLVAQCIATGTSVARFRAPRAEAAQPLSIMPVNTRGART